jgi:hypothetical protein
MVFRPVLESSLGAEVDDTQEGSWSRCYDTLSCPVAIVGGGALPRGCEAPQACIFGGELTARVPGTKSPWTRLPEAWVI